MAARKPFIAGNWKMNPETVEEAVALAKEIVEAAKTSKAQVRIVSITIAQNDPMQLHFPRSNGRIVLASQQ
jgi:triosephosphate isomerase